jgi:hypothetical protein
LFSDFYAYGPPYNSHEAPKTPAKGGQEVFISPPRPSQQVAKRPPNRLLRGKPSSQTRNEGLHKLQYRAKLGSPQTALGRKVNSTIATCTCFPKLHTCTVMFRASACAGAEVTHMNVYSHETALHTELIVHQTHMVRWLSVYMLMCICLCVDTTASLVIDVFLVSLDQVLRASRMCIILTGPMGAAILISSQLDVHYCALIHLVIRFDPGHLSFRSRIWSKTSKRSEASF